MKIKQELHKLCVENVYNRLQTVNKIITSNQQSLASETKSSAGDKHETGRAMLQLEMEKAGLQLAGIRIMEDTLARIDPEKKSKIAHLGSVINTNKANYFLSISVGKLTVLDKDYFAISVVSPIGKLLLGKQENDIVVFNGNEIVIEQIC